MKGAVREQVDVSFGEMLTNTPDPKLNSKIAYALFTGMVRDKVGYVIREICKNAWEVGAFEVHLPTRFQPIFKVRDYGPGLSPEFMMERYPKLGDSTKDEMGVDGMSGWGFGSKSPFAYLMEDDLAGDYTVTSYQEGFARIYSISLDIRGMPQIKLVFEMPTDERDGLEVSFAVRAEDCDLFRRRAADILWSFDPRPQVFPDLGWQDARILNQGEGWKIYDQATIPWRGPQIKAGCVMYPVELKEVEGLIGFIQPTDNIVFDVPPNEVKVTSSREALQYSNSTKQTLSSLIRAYEENFLNILQEKVNEAEDYFEASNIFQRETGAFGIQRRAALRPKVKWSSLEIRDTLEELPVKAMLLSEGWSRFDRFEGQVFHPFRAVGAKIAVEFNPFRSFDRMAKFELIGQKLLWLRMKRANKDEVFLALGLTDEDVVILDSAKLEFTKWTLADGSPKPKTMRVRAILEGMTMRRALVDLAGSGFYMKKIEAGRRRAMFSLGTDFKEVYIHDVHDIIMQMQKLKFFEEPPTILIPGPDDELNDSWTMIGPYLEEMLLERFKPEEINPHRGRGTYAMSGELMDMCGSRPSISFDKGPAELRAFQKKARELYELLRTAESRATDQDHIYDLLKRLRPTATLDNVIKVPDPVPALKEEYASLQKKYPLLQPLIQGSKMSYGWRSTQDGYVQKHLDQYFSLLPKEG